MLAQPNAVGMVSNLDHFAPKSAQSESCLFTTPARSHTPQYWCFRVVRFKANPKNLFLLIYLSGRQLTRSNSAFFRGCASPCQKSSYMYLLPSCSWFRFNSSHFNFGWNQLSFNDQAVLRQSTSGHQTVSKQQSCAVSVMRQKIIKILFASILGLDLIFYKVWLQLWTFRRIS